MMKMMTWRREKIAAFGRVIPSEIVRLWVCLCQSIFVAKYLFLILFQSRLMNVPRLNYGVRSINYPYYSDALP